MNRRLTLSAFVLGLTCLSAVALADPPASSAPTPDPLKRSDFVMYSPGDYQVFQRQTRKSGMVLVSGHANVRCDGALVKVSGKSIDGALPAKWEPMPIDRATGGFCAWVPVAAGGWYELEVRATNKGVPVAEGNVEHFGVGEVFVGAGQSNSTNCGGEGKLKIESGMVATFDGSTWRLADDPQPGTHDKSTGGSFWPAFGDAMAEKYHVPIGVAVTGHGGTSTNQWQPGGELFNWMMTRVQQLGRGGFRAVLWHQGESDVKMTSDEYARKLATIIAASNSQAGWAFPWFVARVSYHNPAEASFPSTREGQKILWDRWIALEGPDTDTLTGDYRDEGGKGIHFNPKGLKAHGKMWAEKVGAYLDKVLGP